HQLPDVPRTDPAVRFSRKGLFTNTRLRISITPVENSVDNYVAQLCVALAIRNGTHLITQLLSYPLT
ncbi:MAG: hypothetical protein JSW07_08215, partial [bacterium]